MTGRQLAGTCLRIWWGLGLMSLLYTLPWGVATLRRSRDTGSIAVINLFLGWTVVGWVVALAWACRGKQP
ncbi:MAG TPA: superinfection immunity protein [Gemmatimonadales bacterium]